MKEPLLELLGHKTWATVSLIEHCKSLSEDALHARIPGTFGTIPDTLRHVVDADEDYFWMLTKRHLAEPTGNRPLDLDDLAVRVRGLGPEWEKLAMDPGLGAREAVADDGVCMPAAVAIAQAIHHADDHRTQILTILGTAGLEVPRLDVWAYARSRNELREPPVAKP